MITPAFETVWPDVERRLRALLYRRGLDQASAEDVVQEVALRALSGGVTFTSAKDLLRWAAPVACNLHVDLLRQRAWLEHEVDADRPCSSDVARQVADRLELQRALRGLAALRPADRAAIMDAVRDDHAEPRTRKEAVRLAVRRHRARSRLVLAMEQLAAWVVGWRWLRQPSAVATAAVLVPAAAFPLLFTTPAPSSAPPTSRAPAASEPAVRPPAARDARAVGPAAAGTTATGTGRAPSGRAGAARATAAPEPAAPTQPPLVDLHTADGKGAKVHTDDRREGDKHVCITDLPVVGAICEV
ncbi:MAG TPA: sigma-70 family RNA polymerase sigma factor [Frankiaceae bacterium]|nr:sigma-70 family RNA polymerase sigma factor [Frankiaceae bacterium]